MTFDIWKLDLSGYYYENPKIQSGNKEISNGEYDLLLTNGKEYLIFEMQNRDYGNFVNRTSIYRSTLISMKWEKGDKKYEGILPVKIFWLLNYSYEKSEYLDYQMLEKSLLKEFGDKNEVHIFQIKKYHRSKLLEKYKILFNATKKDDIEALTMDKRVGKIAKKILEYNLDLNMYQEMRRRDDMIISYERELALARGTSYMKGEAVGEAKGEKRGEKSGRKAAQKEIASNLIKEGIPLELIAKATKLPLSQIKNYVKSE